MDLFPSLIQTGISSRMKTTAVLCPHSHSYPELVRKYIIIYNRKGHREIKKQQIGCTFTILIPSEIILKCDQYHSHKPKRKKIKRRQKLFISIVSSNGFVKISHYLVQCRRYHFPETGMNSALTHDISSPRRLSEGQEKHESNIQAVLET